MTKGEKVNDKMPSSKKRKRSKNNGRRRPIPLVPSTVSDSKGNNVASNTSSLILSLKSRKRARQITTQFHKLTRERDMAIEKGDMKMVEILDTQLQNMGGRQLYQRASQLSTSYHSTSKWILGELANNGWLYGIKEENDGDEATTTSKGEISVNNSSKKQKPTKRPTRILEVGAINTELLDAAEATVTVSTPTWSPTVPTSTETSSFSSSTIPQKKKYNINVRAIDIHSINHRIEEMDFFQLPYLGENIHNGYDVVVCSMVLNCVTTPEKRGFMLCQIYRHLRPGGLCFLTIPKFCLTKSAFLTTELFHKLLQQIGYEVISTKDSPKVCFFILKRPMTRTIKELDLIWTKLIIRNKGKKYPNQFSIVLSQKEVYGDEEQDNKQSITGEDS